jgi:hypothetical protein
MNNLQPTDMSGTLIADLIDMVQKRMGIDLESLEANPGWQLGFREYVCNRALRASCHKSQRTSVKWHVWGADATLVAGRGF